MASPVSQQARVRLARIGRGKGVRTGATLGLVFLAPVLVAATLAVLGPLDQGANSNTLRLVLLADLVYAIALSSLVIQQIVRVIGARRAKSAGSRLHLRLTAVFGLVALVPAVAVAVFAGITVNVGLEGWFSERVRNVVGSSLAAAQAYEGEQRAALIEDGEALAEFLGAAATGGELSDGELRQLLAQGQGLIQRGLREAFVIDAEGSVQARGERSYLFDYEVPSAQEIAAAAKGPIVVEDWDNNEFRVLLALPSQADRFLYLSRTVDGGILSLLDETQETVRLYQQLEAERGRLVFEFGLLYLGFAVLLVLAAIWLGLIFAERLSRPVGRLAGAAQRVGAGDLDTQVREEQGDDEIAMLGRVFNRMTRELKAQREELLESTRHIEQRRRLFDSILSSVQSGVIALDAEGNVTLVNRAAGRLLEVDAQGQPLVTAVPEFADLLDKVRAHGAEAQEEIRVSRGGKLEHLLVRVAGRRLEDGALEGYVVAFDDVSDLVAAQRNAAWGDVARRIAHEIKNPLTPIQLSAQRIQRKFGLVEGVDAEALGQYTEVIVRQTEGLRRIVNEFSRFARMPEPDRQPSDLAALVSDAVLLQREGQPDVSITLDLPDGPVPAALDEGMIGQALTNLIKNAGEATETLRLSGEAPDGWTPEVRVALIHEDDQAVLTIADNGIGLPEDRSRLFEPYFTTRSEGTGLGLPIVRKIIAEHGGTLELRDAAPFEPGMRAGAEARIALPTLDRAAQAEPAQQAYEQKQAV